MLLCCKDGTGDLGGSHAVRGARGPGQHSWAQAGATQAEAIMAFLCHALHSKVKCAFDGAEAAGPDGPGDSGDAEAVRGAG